MRVAFFTLGCKVNQYETSVLAQAFGADGFDVVEPEEEADVYVVNSCTVTASGDKKSRQMLRRFRRQNPSAVVCLCGCFPQAFPDAAEKIPEADIIMGSGNRAGLLGAVRRRLAGEERIVSITPHEKGEAFEQMSIAQMRERTRAFVKIQDGCERFCTYCIIPTARGPVRSKPLQDLRRELEALAADNYQEVVLVGINLSCYGADLGLRLLDAVELACSVPGLARVRLGSLEPELLSPGDIAAMARQPKLCPQFHLSLQSGSDATLRRMGRHYTTAQYSQIVADLRAHFPGCAITTDVMVGFPGETQEEYEASRSFVEQIGFARAHVFAYSIRPGTAAQKLEGHLDSKTKADRSRHMLRAVENSRQRFLQEMQGKQVEVLFETKGEAGSWEGYSENYTPVRVLSPENLAGQIRPVILAGVEEEFATGWLEE